MAVVHSVHPEPGRVEIDRGGCRGCGECARICPADVLRVEAGQAVVRDDSPFGCIACGHCMMVCPENAIRVTGRGVSPEDLLVCPHPEAKATPEELAALMEGRRSIRRFCDHEVEADVLDCILEMAASAPMGVPPWDVGCAVIRGREQVQALAGKVVQGYERLLKVFRPWLLALMRPLIGRARYEQFRTFILPLARMLVEHRRQGSDVLFYDAPAVIIFHYSAYVGEADAVIACTYAMLAAESLGLGTTMVGSAAPIISRDKDLLRACGIPDGHKPALVLILGYPAAEFKRGIRRRFVSVTGTGNSNGQVGD